MTKCWGVYRDGNFCFEVRGTKQELVLWSVVNLCPLGAPKENREKYLAENGIKVVKVNVVPAEPVV